MAIKFHILEDGSKVVHLSEYRADIGSYKNHMSLPLSDDDLEVIKDFANSLLTVKTDMLL